MGKVVTFHSYRGGTGKTVTALNLAALDSKMGKNVCLLEVDFRAPSLHIVFKNHTKMWVNDFLDGRCEVEEVVEDFAETYGTKGRLMVGLANPRMEAIRDYSTKGRKWQTDALRRLLSLGKFLKEDMKMDYVFLDSSPGITYSALNAIVASDLTVVVTTLDRSDVDGSDTMIREFHGVFEEKASVLVNKVVASAPFSISEEERKEYLNEVKKTFHVPILGMIPCYCDVSRLRATGIFVFEKPQHPLTKDFEKVADRLDHL